MTNDMNGLNDLPEGWAWTTIGEIANTTRKRVLPQERPDLPFIGMENIEAHTMRLLGTVPAGEMKSSAEYFEPGDVMYGRLRPYLNKVYCPKFEGLCSSEFIVFRKTPRLKSEYLQYFLNSWDFVTFASHLNTGDRPRVNFDQLADHPFPLAPLPEQQRIVTEIEKQFTRLEAGVAALKRAQANLKQYKAAVLKAACEGKLVEQDPGDEPAKELLTRILAERRAKWEADLIAKGRDPKKAKYEEPKSPDPDELPELPRGWCWASAEQFSDETRAITYGVIKLGDPVEDGIPVLRSSDVRHLHLELDHIKRVDPSIANEFKRTFLQGGEVLVTVRGTLGGVVVVPDECKGFNISREVAMIAPVIRDVGPVLSYFIASKPIQNWLLQRTKGIAYTGINIETLKQTPIPLPPLAEQRRIVAEVERRLSVVQELEGTLAANLARAERLRQAILKRAFEGRLVPQMMGHHENP
jgi:type I restriction enzyme S subunit